MSNKIFFTEKEGLFSIPIPVENFTVNDANSEFTDGLFVSWSYPLTLYFNSELSRKLGNINRANNSKGKFTIDGILSKYGKLYPCKMKVSNLKKLEAKINFEFGVGSLDVMDKKLSEIDLGIIETTGLYDYIDANLFEVYPDVPICFPRIRTPKDYAAELGTLYGGRNIFNDSNTSMATTQILRNYFGTSGQAKFNFIKPIVYLLHILVKGFESAGYILKGDILTDPKLLHVGFDHNNTADVELKRDIKRISFNYYVVGTYGTAEEFDIIGAYYFSLIVLNSDSDISMKVINLENNTVLYENYKNGMFHVYDSYGNIIDTPTTVDFIELLPTFSETTKVRVELVVTQYSGYWLDTFTAYLNPSGGTAGEKAFALPNNLVLNKYVPDVTFIEVVKTAKILRNYKIDIINNEIHMNRISNELPTVVKDLRFSEQEDVEISSNEILGYIFKYSAPEEFSFTQFLYTRDALPIQALEIPEDDYEVREIMAYPLPMTVNLINGNSADEVIDNVDGLAMVKYSGTKTANNSDTLVDFSIPSLYENSYKNWIFGRLDAIVQKWSASSKNPEFLNLESTDCIFAYDAYHKIINLITKYHENNIVEVEIQTENRY